MAPRPANRFYLVQRLKPTTFTARAGFDGFFSCEYMGSAEFEWGALPDSLRRMRAAKLTRTSAEVNGTTVYFVHPKSNTSVVDDFLEWLTAPGRFPHSKEQTYLPEILAGSRPEYVETIAWWSLDDDVMIAIDEPTALRLIEAVNSKAKG